MRTTRMRRTTRNRWAMNAIMMRTPMMIKMVTNKFPEVNAIITPVNMV